MKRKGITKLVVTCLVLAMLLAVLPVSAFASGEEIIDKGGRVTWVDASVQLPNNYASIIGFKLTFKLVTDHTNYVDGYGGVTEDPTSPEYNMKFPCYMLVASKGAHGTDEFNENTFWCAEDENYEHYLDEDLAKQEIVKIGVGSGYYVAGYLDNGRAYSSLSYMTAGDTGTITYKGTEALFEQGDPIMTFYGYTAEFEILSIEWITGTPTVSEEVDWDTVEKTTYADISTAEHEETQNGSNYVNIITPAEGDGPFPVILWIHGGGWSTSSRTDIILNTTMEYFLAQGYAFVSVEYTLSERNAALTEEEQAKIDACQTQEEKDALTELYSIKNATQGKQMVYDIKQAIRFLRANGEQYNLDTTFICAMGESAGAHLSLLMSTTNGSEEHEAWDVETMEWKDYSSDIQCVVAYSIPTDMSEDSASFLMDYTDEYALIEELGKDYMAYNNFVMAYCVLGYDYIEAHTDGDPLNGGTPDAELLAAERFLSPFYQVNSDTPPMYLIHGEKDGAVSIHHAYAMELQAKIYMDEEDVKTAYWPEAGHVEKQYLDSYAQYVSTYEFVEAVRLEFLSADETTEPDESGDEPTTPDTQPSGGEQGGDETPGDENGGLVIVIVCIAAVAVIAVVAVVVIKRKRG